MQNVALIRARIRQNYTVVPKAMASSEQRSVSGLLEHKSPVCPQNESLATVELWRTSGQGAGEDASNCLTFSLSPAP
jgi:hypothetical protein